MAEQWAISARGNPLWERSEEQQTITIIQHLLTNKISPRKAAETLASTYEACIKQGDPRLWHMWKAFFDAINQLGDNTDNLKRLAQMIRSVSNLPDVLDDRGQAIKSEINGQVFWRDVPGFGFYFSEAAIDFIHIDDLDRGRFGETWDNATRKLLTGNTFAALYLRELDPDGPPRDFVGMRNQARNHLMYALEIATDTPGRVRRTEVYVPQAALWILIAGRNIYHYSKSNQDDTGEPVIQRWVGGEHGGDLMWTGRDGFNLERWAFWKRRFEEISELQGVKEDARQHAATAAEEMCRIHSEGKG